MTKERKRIGDGFECKDVLFSDNYWFLVQVGKSEVFLVGHNVVNRLSDPVKVANTLDISDKEWEALIVSTKPDVWEKVEIELIKKRRKWC